MIIFLRDIFSIYIYFSLDIRKGGKGAFLPDCRGSGSPAPIQMKSLKKLID
jgi:hypothetical protein